jgi:hypothetical protein
MGYRFRSGGVCVFIYRAIVMTFLVAVMPYAAAAEDAVKIGNSYALLNKPSSAQAAVILIPGGHGRLDIQADGRFSALRNK